MANLLRWSAGMALPKKKEENNVFQTSTPLISSLKTMSPTINNRISSVSRPSNSFSSTNNALNNSLMRTQQINERIRQQAEQRRQQELQRQRQEEQQRQQRLAEQQRQQEQRKQQEQAKKLAQQRQQEQKQRNLLNSAGLGNFGLNTDIRSNIETQRKLRQQAQERAAAKKQAEEAKNPWKKYYDEEKQKVRDQAFKNSWGDSTLQDIFNAGWDSRLAETNAKNRYASELLNQGQTEKAKKAANEAVNTARQYQEQEHARGKALGATYDSDYYTGFDWDPSKNKAHANNIGEAFGLLGKQFHGVLNAVRSMDVGNAMTGGAEGGVADAGKFVLNLFPGMFSAPIQGAGNIMESFTGKGTDQKTGEHRELTGLERLGRAASGAIDAAGVLYGGSGDFLNAMAGKLFKQGATEATKQAVKQTSKEVIKGYIKAMLEEGAEEAVQQAFEFFGDGGRLVTEDGEFDADSFKQLLAESAQAGGLGALGGGIFHGGAQALGSVKSNLKNSLVARNARANTNLNTNVNENTNLVDNVDTNVNENLVENVNEKTNIDPARVQITRDGTMVKTNTDGTTTKLSDNELANVVEQSSYQPAKALGTNPFIDNSVKLTSSTEDINTLLERANNGDESAKQKLAEILQQSLQENQNSDWRGKSVEEAINPEDNAEPKTIYHGTPNTFEDFDENLPSVWFSDSDKNLRDSGLTIKGDSALNVMERILPNDLKLADEDLADRLTKQQLIDRGYEGIAYTERGPNGDETYYEIFNPNKTLSKVSENNQVDIKTPSELDESPEILDSERAVNDDSEELANAISELYGPMPEDTQVAPSYDEDLSMQKIADVLDGKTSFDDYIGDQRELLWKSFKDSQRGVDRYYLHQDPESNDITRRVTESNNGTLYRQLYQEYGGKPTKANFNEALNDVLINGKDSKYYDGFREFDHDGERSIFDFNQGNEDIDMILDLKEEMEQRTPSNQEVATGTEPLGYAKDGTAEFVQRYTKQTKLNGEDNSQLAREKRLARFMDSIKSSDNTIVKKIYDLWKGDRKNSVVANLNGKLLKRYVSEGHVALSNDAKFVMTGNFVSHLDNDGHLTGIWKNPEPKTGVQIDANPLTQSDLAILDKVLEDPDLIRYAGKGSRSGDKIRIEKRVGDNMRVIAEVLNNGKDLELISYYKTNKTPLEGALPTSGTSGLSGLEEQANPASRSTEAAAPVESAANLTQNIAENTENVNQAADTLPEDFDVKHYVTDQAEAQKKRSKVPLRERVADATAELKHYLVDDAVAYERYIKDKNERLNIREGVDRVRSSDMIARQYMQDHGLGEVVKMSDADLNEFQQYLIAKRALEVAEQGKATGRSKAADQALIESVGNKYAKEEAIIRQYTRDMLEYSADNGLISEKLKDKLIEENPNYVPMNRVFDVVEKKTGFKSKQLGNLNNQSVVQKMTGSERVVDNPIESLMTNTMRMINEVERNKTAKLISQSEAFHEKTLKDGETPRPGYDKLSYMIDGETVSYEVPELVAKEMKNLNNVLPKAAENILKVTGAPTRWLRSGATQNNPIFAVSNLLRDQMQTVVTGKVSANLKGTKDALIATFSPTEKGKALRNELNRAGIIGSEYRQTYGYKSGDLMAQLQADNKLSESVKNKLKHPVDAIGDLIGRTEYFTRAQQYFGTDGDATTKAQAARNNTLNFNRAGSATRILNRIIPFLNAGVQGGRITVNSFKNRPIHTTLAMASLAGVALAAKGAAEAQDKELWDRIDDSDKGQNIIIFTPDAHYNSETNRVEGIIKIPVAQMLYPIMDATNNLKGDASDATMLAGDIFTAVTGLESPNEEKGLLPVVNQLTPTAFKPFIEAAMNKNTYTGNEIVSEYDSNKAPEDKGAKYTTGLARTIAKATGIDAPVVDNFIQNWGGGLAKDLSKVMTDNPDNKSDGGGIGKMFENGFNRRFLSGTVESQYEIAEGLAKNYKNEVKNTEAFKNLSSDQQQKVLNAIDSDMKGIASISAKVEQGKANEDSSLTKRQTEIVANGFNPDSYINAVTDKKATYSGSGQNGAGQTLNGNVLDYGKTSVRNNPVEISDSISGDSKSILSKYNSMKSDDWNKYLYGTSAEAAAAEYNLALAKYENDTANDDLNEAQKIKREKELAKLYVSQKWTKSYRDAYSLAGTKADMQAYLNTLDDSTRAETVSILNGLNNAMYEAGIIQASTYKTRYNAINNTTSSRSSRKSSKSSTTSDSEENKGISSAEASAIASLAKTMSKADDNVKVKTPEAPTTKRKMSRTKSSGNSTGLKTYTPSLAKNVTVTKGANRSIV